MRATRCVGRKRNDPIKQVSRIVANGTRLWIAYAKAGGSKATFVFPPSGNHMRPYWGQQLSALKPDPIATLNG